MKSAAWWFTVHFVGLILMIIAWGTEDVPELLRPMAGVMYGLGTGLLITSIIDMRLRVK